MKQQGICIYDRRWLGVMVGVVLTCSSAIVMASNPFSGLADGLSKLADSLEQNKSKQEAGHAKQASARPQSSSPFGGGGLLGGLFGQSSRTQQASTPAADFNPDAVVGKLGGAINKGDPLDLSGSMGKEVLGRALSFITGKGSVEQALLNFDVAASALRLSQDLMENVRINDQTEWPEQLAYDPGDRKKVFRDMLMTGVYDVNDLANLIKPIDVVTHTLIDRFYEVKPTLENGYKGTPSLMAIGSGETNTQKSVFAGIIALLPAGLTYVLPEEDAVKIGDAQKVYSPMKLWNVYSQVRMHLVLKEAELLALKQGELSNTAARQLSSDFESESGPASDDYEGDTPAQKAKKEQIKNLEKKLAVYEDGLEYFLDDALQETSEVLDEEKRPLARNLLLVARVCDELNKAAIAKIILAQSNLTAVPYFPSELATLVQKEAAGQLLGGKSRIRRLKYAAASLPEQIPFVISQLYRQKTLSSLAKTALRNMLNGAKFEKVGEATYLAMDAPQSIRLPGEASLLVWPNEQSQPLIDEKTRQAVVLPANSKVERIEVSSQSEYCRVRLKDEGAVQKKEEAGSFDEDDMFSGSNESTSTVLQGWIPIEQCSIKLAQR